MKIVTWNVNSIRARIDGAIAWLERVNPDVVLMQETKVEELQFPFEALGNLGYDVAHFGQKTYNGVAICSRGLAENVVRGFGDGVSEDTQSRLISGEVVVGGKRVLVCSVYVPNGQKIGSGKYSYKLGWLERFQKFVAARASGTLPLVIGGDYNIAPDDRDVYDPSRWHDEVLVSVPERDAFKKLIAAGVSDAYRQLQPEGRAYTWWDFRTAAFGRDAGLRIDHFLLNPLAMAACKSVTVDRELRGGEKASDHAPVVAEFSLQ